MKFHYMYLLKKDLILSKHSILVCFILICFIQSKIQSQTIWSLEQCVERAISSSLQVENSNLSLQSSEIDLNFARHSRYPNLSAGSNVGWNFGRTIDPTNNEFITETFFNNGFNLSSNVLLYGGNRINNSIQQAKTNNLAAKKDVEQIKRDVSLNVSSIFLNLLFAKENLRNAQNQLAITKNQENQLSKQIAVGNRPENDQLDIQAQIATNLQTIVEAENNVAIQLLNLKQILRLSPSDNIDIEVPKGEIAILTDPDMVEFEELYSSALRNQSSVQAGELRYSASNIGLKIAKSGYQPTLSGFGSLQTNYSNKGRKVTGFTDEIINQTIFFNGTPQVIGFQQQIPIIENSPYSNQLTDNLSYGVGLSLNIPIYNRNQVRTDVQRAKLSMSQSELQLVQIKENLKITVGQAHADAKAAKYRLLASNKTYDAQQNLYTSAVMRFDIGGINSFEISRLKTQLETAATNQLIAKYDYIFRTKVLDFYLGKPIQF